MWSTVSARSVIIATGAVPRQPPPTLLAALRARGVRLLSHDDAVSTARLRARLHAHDGHTLLGRRFAVVGGSHSGVLAARHVLELCAAASVDIYRRGPLRLAEERDGWIKYDGTGLKGVARAWAVDVLQSVQRDASCNASTQPIPVQAATEGGSAPLSALRRVRVHEDAPHTGDAIADAAKLADRIVAARGRRWR